MLDSWRLTEIQLGRDPEFDTARELHLPDLLILIVGVMDPPNKFTPALIRSVWELRQAYGRPTWLYEGRSALTLPAATPAAKAAKTKTAVAVHPSRQF